MSKIGSEGVEVGIYVEARRVEDSVDMEDFVDVVVSRKKRSWM